MPAVPLLGQSQPNGQEPTIFPANQEAWAALNRIRETNLELVKQLTQFNIGIDPMTIVQVRFATLLDTLFPPGTPDGQAAQIQVELNFEAAMEGMLREARRNAVTMQLQAGAHVPPEMMEQMARAQGVPPGLRRR